MYRVFSIPRVAAVLFGCCIILAAKSIVIPEGLPVRVRLEQRISSATAVEGQVIHLAVSDDIRVGGIVVIPLNAIVSGTITQVLPKTGWSGTGEIDFTVDYIMAPDGDKIPVRYAIVRTVVKGHDVVLNRGYPLSAYIDTNYTITPHSSEEDKPATLALTSETTGAEIEIDGKFSGTVPSTLQVTPGSHAVRMYKGGSSWNRQISVAPGGFLSLDGVVPKAANGKQ